MNEARTRWGAAIAVAGATIGFAAGVALRSRLDPWTVTSGAALLAIGLATWALGRARLAVLFRGTLGGAAGAAVLGVGLVAATHLAFRALEPYLGDNVRVLYASIDEGVPRLALAAITAGVVVAEELIWRGVALTLVATSRFRAGALAVALYTIPQIIGGEWILFLAALGLGTILTIQRERSGRLVEPMITHAIWSIAIFVVVPLI